jgi:murein DD-endopeptidase MepM/ murein hydrolase activator NlpD
MKHTLLILLILLLSACQPTRLTSTSTSTEVLSVPTQTKTHFPPRAITTTPISTTPKTQPSPTSFLWKICSPLEDETFESLPLILVNPLDIPGFGQDTGHHGVDFAYFQRGERESIQGIEIFAILSGKIVTTLAEGIPYGYAILIETPLKDLPDEIQNEFLDAYLPVPEDPNYRLTCPPVTPPPISGEYSIYHLYAHMESLPTLNSGDRVTCGTILGTVGNSGYSSNPHLHLETRLGPSSAIFTSMAHYENTCTIEEMANYCLWRMSGFYQLFDPFLLFDYQQNQP